MVSEKILHVSKIIFTILIFATACSSWYLAYTTYKENKVDIWLAAEDIILGITLPFKLAALVGEERNTVLQIPVEGILLREIGDTWGASRDSGRTHEGTDIFAERGTPVYAATRGYVIHSGVNKLGGNIVFTIGPGGVRYYYAHLERIAEGIKPGMIVTPDTVVGFVGNTGNASSTPPHLHFGVYENGAENPYPLLIDRD